MAKIHYRQPHELDTPKKKFHDRRNQKLRLTVKLLALGWILTLAALIITWCTK